MAAEQNEQPSRRVSARVILQEERYLWMARAFVVMLVLAVICDLILLIALANVTPVMRVQPFYLETQNKEQQIISVTRPSVEMLNSDALKESLVRQYLLARFGISADLTELSDRWGGDGPVFWMSDQSIYEAFQNTESRALWEAAQKDNFTRDVVIQKLNKTNSTNSSKADVWYGVLEFKDMNRVSVSPQVSYWDFDIATVFRPLRQGLTWKDRLKNPLGFTVVNFGLHKHKENSEN